MLLAPFVLTCLVYLSLPAFVAMLPQSRQRSRQRQLAIGAFAGMLSALGGLVAPQLIEHLSNGTHLVIRPALVAVCCFTFGPLSGAVAAALPLVAHLLTGAQDLSMGAALLQAVAVVTLGSALAVIRARHEARSNWLLLALAALLPVALAPWAAGGPATWPWHYGVAVLALGSLLELHRAYRHTVRQLSTREQELLQTLEAFGSGHWEWQLRGGRFVFIYHGVFYQAFGLPQDPGPDGVAHDVAWQRWNALPTRRTPTASARTCTAPCRATRTPMKPSTACATCRAAGAGSSRAARWSNATNTAAPCASWAWMSM